MRKIALVLAISSLFFTPLHGKLLLFGSENAYALDDWMKEFDDVCSKTQDALAFTADELKNFLERCDALKPIMEKLDEPQRTVNLRRLKMCRGLYSFVLEQKEHQ
jgi:hypothetical protein